MKSLPGNRTRCKCRRLRSRPSRCEYGTLRRYPCRCDCGRPRSRDLSRDMQSDQGRIISRHVEFSLSPFPALTPIPEILFLPPVFPFQKLSIPLIFQHSRPIGNRMKTGGAVRNKLQQFPGNRPIFFFLLVLTHDALTILFLNLSASPTAGTPPVRRSPPPSPSRSRRR